MRTLALAAAIVAGGVASAAALEASFSWAGIRACGGTSPAFKLTGVPKGTTQLKFSLTDYNAPLFRHGGSTVPYDGKGAVAQGAISYVGPCPPPSETHRYIWTITALDAGGKSLAETKAEGLFPK